MEAVANMGNLNKAVNKLKKLALEFDKKYQVTQQVTVLMTPLFNQLKKLEKRFESAKESLNRKHYPSNLFTALVFLGRVAIVLFLSFHPIPMKSIFS